MSAWGGPAALLSVFHKFGAMSFLTANNRPRGVARVLFCADVRLGDAPLWLPSKQRQSALLERRLAFGAVVNAATQSPADGLVICGGLFSRYDPQPAEIAAAAAGLETLRNAGISCYAIHAPDEIPPEDSISGLELLSRLGLIECVESKVGTRVFDLRGLRVAMTALVADPSLRGNPLRKLNFAMSGDVHVLLARASVERLAPAGPNGPIIDSDSINALTGVNLLVAGGSPRPQRLKAKKTTVISPGAPLRPAPDGGFANVTFGKNGVLEVQFESGVGLPAGEVLVPASLLETQDANSQIRRMLDEASVGSTEVTMRVYGRTAAPVLREAGLAELCEYGRSLTARFSLDVSGLLTVEEPEDCGRGPLAVVEQIEELLEADDSTWRSSEERIAARSEVGALLRTARGIGGMA